MSKTSIQNGIFLGLALVISSYIIYLANPNMYLTARSSILFLIFLLIMIKSGLDARKSNGGFINFKSAFINMFITGAIGTFLCTLFEYIHVNFMAPELIEMQRELALEAAEKVSGLFGDLGEEFEEEMEAQLEKLEEENFASLPNSIKNYFLRLIAPVAFFSAIIGAIIKRKGQSNGDDLDKDEGPRYIVNK